MAADREIRSYDYVNHPYEQVRDALRRDAKAVFRAATQAASTRAEKVAAALHVDVAGIRLSRDVVIEVKRIEETPTSPRAMPETTLELAWEAAESPRLFPLMRAELHVYALTSTETQLDFQGHYRPPLGALGRVMDAIVGHRIAEASVHCFLADVAAHLRQSLTG